MPGGHETPVRQVPQELAPAAPAPSARPHAPEAPAGQDWEALRAQVQSCTRCPLCEVRSQTVFGIGNPQARVMFIGEGPGEQEDLVGEPFVGHAGQLLDAMLDAIGMHRESVYITNVVKCHPPHNRNPHAEEIRQCAAYLQRQIELVRPRLLVALGAVAARHLLDSTSSLNNLRGPLRQYQDIPLLVTFHPAYLLRSPAQKRHAWEDLKTLLRTLS